jgi:two-component system, LytTR family, sensor kinase
MPEPLFCTTACDSCISTTAGIESREMALSKPKRIARAYLLSIGIWSALSLLTGWSYLIFDQSIKIHSTLSQMLLLAESRGLAYALLTPPIFYIVRRYAYAARRKVRYLLGYTLGVVPFMLITACVRWAILPPWDSSSQRFGPHWSSTPLQLLHVAFADMITIYFATVVAAHAFNYFERVRKQELERSEYQQALAASELQALKMQLHPHFLFNTLHGISTLIDTDGKSAKTMIVKLSNLLRQALDQRGSDLIPLQEELKFIGEYLDLETMRFGPRLTVTWSIAPDTRRTLVPQLILQPLVENAIRHGIASSREKGWIEIGAHLNKDKLELQIRNSATGKKPGGSGVGLRNTESRLRYLYADEAAFCFELLEDGTASAALSLPALGSNLQSVEYSLASERILNGAETHARINHR